MNWDSDIDPNARPRPLTFKDWITVVVVTTLAILAIIGSCSSSGPLALGPLPTAGVAIYSTSTPSVHPSPTPDLDNFTYLPLIVRG